MVERSAVVIIILAFLIAQACLYPSSSDSSDDSSSVGVSSLAVPEDFTLRYTVKDINATGITIYQSTFDLSSDGAARYVDSWINPDQYPASDLDGVLDEELINETREAMDQDGLLSYEGTFNDANWEGQAFSKHVEEIELQTAAGNTSLRFMGNAMIGILPQTYVILTKLVWQLAEPDMEYGLVSVDVSATLDSDAILTMSAVVRNNASHQYSMTGVCEGFWPVTIVRTNGCSIMHSPSDYIQPTCIVTIGPGASYIFEPLTWNASDLAKGEYVVLASPGMMGTAMFEVTEDLGHVNSAPRVYVEVVEVQDSADYTYMFDASESCDAEDIGTALEVRWDWYGDGIWDTDWSVEKTAEYSFENMTGYNLTVEVRDTEGLSSSVSFGMSMSVQTKAIFLPSAFATVVVAALAVAAFLLLRKRRLSEGFPPSDETGQ